MKSLYVTFLCFVFISNLSYAQKEGDYWGYFIEANRKEFDSILPNNKFIGNGYVGEILEGTYGFNAQSPYWGLQDIYVRPGQHVYVNYKNNLYQNFTFSDESIKPYIMSGVCDTVVINALNLSGYNANITFTIYEDVQIAIARNHADSNDLKSYALLNIKVVPHTLVDTIVEPNFELPFVTQNENLMQFHFKNDNMHEVYILNNLGQSVDKIQANNGFTIELKEYKKGIYYLKTEINGNQKLGKVIVF